MKVLQSFACPPGASPEHKVSMNVNHHLILGLVSVEQKLSVILATLLSQTNLVLVPASIQHAHHSRDEILHPLKTGLRCVL